MGRILLVYASIDGQTERIAQRVAEHLGRSGHSVVLRPADKAPSALADCDAVMVGAAIRYGHYPPAVEKWVASQREAIAARPNAFFSVCLSAGGPGARPKTAEAYVAQFLKRTGWQPRAVASFAGALLYRHYNPFIRFMMRLIVGMAGGDTDTSREYEYTDWSAVERFAGEFAAQARATA